MKNSLHFFLWLSLKPAIILMLLFLMADGLFAQKGAMRVPVDSVGFAVTASQMDSVMVRLQRGFGIPSDIAFARARVNASMIWKLAICPHDDYAYAGWMYPLALKNIKAPVVILIGVAHKAARYGLEDKMVFDRYRYWHGPYQRVRVSPLREKISNQLPRSSYVVNDSLHAVEHSLEALIPFLQYYNRKVEIIPILIPAMSFQTMEGLSFLLAKAINEVLEQESLTWMRDIAIVISNDAVHYGCEGWGGKDLAPYGCEQEGYLKALDREYTIIETTLTGKLTKEKVREFSRSTVQDTNFREYVWSWCGRYAVPFGLLTGLYLQEQTNTVPLMGTMVGYSTSIDHAILPVKDLGMGVTAPANLRHWVGYVSIGYR